jgi:hypothetical protein
MMDQKVEEEKERKRRIIQRIISAFFLGLFILNIVLSTALNPLSIEMQLKGRVLMFIPNRDSALLVLSNKVFPVFDDWILLDKNIKVGDIIKKETMSDTLSIYRNGKESKIKLEFRDSSLHSE